MLVCIFSALTLHSAPQGTAGDRRCKDARTNNVSLLLFCTVYSALHLCTSIFVFGSTFALHNAQRVLVQRYKGA